MKKSDLDKIQINNLSPELIDEWIGKFNNNNSIEDCAVKKAFDTLKGNKEIPEVMVKVTMVNQFYHTRILDKNIQAVAEYICGIEGLDELINAGDISAVKEIAHTPDGMNNLYSFASKYCSFSKDDSYPIVDGISRGVLYVIGRNDEYIVLQSLKGYKHLVKCDIEYGEYKEIVDELIKLIFEKYQKKYSYKDIDKFLWKYGKESIKTGKEIKFDS